MLDNLEYVLESLHSRHRVLLTERSEMERKHKLERSEINRKIRQNDKFITLLSEVEEEVKDKCI